LMVGVELLAQRWRVLLGAAEGERIGVLLPNVNATPVTVLSLWAADKVPALLNFSTGTTTMLICAQLAGLKRIITSRAFVERTHLVTQPFRDAGIELLYLEDVRGQINGAAKLAALAVQTLNPTGRIRNPKSESAVILFTSGSEGVPKGVELTHQNLLANARQMISVIDIEDRDRLFNALPLFHSFGLTVGTLLPLIRGIYVFLYPSPLHYRVVPAAVYDRACTIMLGTNTFLNGYARKASPYDFRSLRLLFAGAEKLQEATANTWARRFGVRILEGYGATECSPCISVNTPMQPCYGSAGRFLPDIEFKLEAVQGVPEGGRLFVRGPNVMRGYLNADANAKFQALGGWYDTGDVVNIDAEGFVHILGRLKRFAKVSGEMVSLAAVEEALAGAFPEYGFRCEIAIISRPDADRGEALIAVSNEPKLRLDQIRAVLKEKGFSNLCVPREVVYLREIPKLGTGKVNHRELEKQF
jgi:acyl-[acyl-carrier-protein]-phospholipid O-acyltransferase / long-chain-fatty-acid--[acyl-carrier-protein] ligase